MRITLLRLSCPWLLSACLAGCSGDSSTSTASAGSSTNSSTSEFVTRKGDQLLLGESEFHFLGSNNYADDPVFQTLSNFSDTLQGGNPEDYAPVADHASGFVTHD